MEARAGVGDAVGIGVGEEPAEVVGWGSLAERLMNQRARAARMETERAMMASQGRVRPGFAGGCGARDLWKRVGVAVRG